MKTANVQIPNPSNNFEEDYYKENYPHYVRQNPPKKMRLYRKMLEKHRLEESPRTLHDIGCAFGRFLQSCESQWTLNGSDVSHHAIEVAQKQLNSATLRVGSGATEHLFKEPFGAVTAFDVLEHIPEVEKTPKIISEQLVPGGVFLFVVPVYDGMSGPIIQKLDKDPTHLHKWPRKKWLLLMSKEFEILEWQGILRYLLPAGPYLHAPLKGWGKYHTPAIIVACRKPQNP